MIAKFAGICILERMALAFILKARAGEKAALEVYFLGVH